MYLEESRQQLPLLRQQLHGPCKISVHIHGVVLVVLMVRLHVGFLQQAPIPPVGNPEPLGSAGAADGFSAGKVMGSEANYDNHTARVCHGASR